MTRAQLKSLKADIPLVTNLFADGNGTSAQKGWNDPFDYDLRSRFINWDEGIPPDYAMPYQNSGKKILRKDMNAVGNVASRELFLLQHGGYHTFDEKVADAIGGYPFGAFLDWYQPSTGWLRKVRCVQEGGNCFTPIDDIEHGVDSGEPHWEIVDYMEEADQDAGKWQVTTLSVTAPTKMLVEYGGFALALPEDTPLPRGVVVKSDPWTAPFDAMITVPLYINNPPYADSSSKMYDFANPDIKVLNGSGVIVGVDDFGTALEVSDASGVFEMALGTRVSLKNFAYDEVIDWNYQLCPRMFIKKGTSLRLIVWNRKSDLDFSVSWSVLRFDVKEVS